VPTDGRRRPRWDADADAGSRLILIASTNLCHPRPFWRRAGLSLCHPNPKRKRRLSSLPKGWFASWEERKGAQLRSALPGPIDENRLHSDPRRERALRVDAVARGHYEKDGGANSPSAIPFCRCLSLFQSSSPFFSHRRKWKWEDLKWRNWRLHSEAKTRRRVTTSRPARAAAECGWYALGKNRKGHSQFRRGERILESHPRRRRRSGHGHRRELPPPPRARHPFSWLAVMKI